MYFPIDFGNVKNLGRKHCCNNLKPFRAMLRTRCDPGARLRERTGKRGKPYATEKGEP